MLYLLRVDYNAISFYAIKVYYETEFKSFKSGSCTIIGRHFLAHKNVEICRPPESVHFYKCFKLPVLSIFLQHAFSARLQFETELNKRSETINQLALELSRAQDNLSLTEKDCADLMFAAKSRERALENQYRDLIGQMEAMKQRVCGCGKKIFVYDDTDSV